MAADNLRILHVAASLAPVHGGPTEAALGMVRALRAEGVDASILSSNDNAGDVLDVPLNRWTDHEGVPVHFLPRVKSKQHTLAGFTFAPAFVPWLREHLREYDFAHVHTVFSFPANVTMRAARKVRLPYAVRPLGQLCQWSLGQRNFVKRLQLAMITRRNVNGAAFIHTTSRMEADETAMMNFRSPCKVLPLGMDAPPVVSDARSRLRAELGIGDDRPVLVFMSRFHEKKGIELLLDACDRLRDRPFALVLAGMGEDAYVAKLKERIVSLPWKDRVHWFGFARDERKWLLLQGGDVFVLPSYSENFGIAVLEALACGLPVIVSEHVALADEVAAESLGRSVPLDVAALAGALAELMDDPAARATMRERGVRIANERFTWRAAARRLKDAYLESIPARS